MIENHNTKPWFRDEITRILLGINLSSRINRKGGTESDEFRKGFLLALTSIAIIIGIRPGLIMEPDDLLMLDQWTPIPEGESSRLDQP